MNLEKIKELMVDKLGVEEDKVTESASLAEDLNIDSLDAVELVMAIEEEIDVKIPDEELEAMKTVQDILDAIEKYK